MRTLAVVSGGDAPGTNAALYRLAWQAERAGDQVIGAVGGMIGAVEGHLVDLRTDLLAPTQMLGGSYITSSREPALQNPLSRVRLIETISRQRIDNIILFGGDGSLRHIPPVLYDIGIACIGIPTTIDNDVPGSDETIGFDSACNAAHRVIDSLMVTARALPGRIFSVETLGGSTGFLALEIAYVVGADAVLIPEVHYEDAWLAERLTEVATRRKMALVVLSEGIPASRTFAEDMQRQHNLRVRDTRLGHGQRGTTPTHRDRWLAVCMADVALAALRNKVKTGLVVMQHGQVSLCEAFTADLTPRQPDRQLYEQINGLI